MEGVENFIQVACQLHSFKSIGMFKYPCIKNKNQAFLKLDDVKVDLYHRSFVLEF